MGQQTVSYATIFYFLPLSFVGAFLILNLTLAVIKSAFTKSMEKIRQPKNSPELEEEELDYSSDNEETNRKPESSEKKNSIETKYNLLINKQSLVNDSTQTGDLNNIRKNRRSSSTVITPLNVNFFAEHNKEISKLISEKRSRKKRSSTVVQSRMINTRISDDKNDEKDFSDNDSEKTFRNLEKKKKLKLKKKVSRRISEMLKKGIGKSLKSLKSASFITEKNTQILDKKPDPLRILPRLKRAISIRKDLIKKIKKNKKINEITFFVAENFDLYSNSTKDVIPKTNFLRSLDLNLNNFYSFSYKTTQSGVQNELEESFSKTSKDEHPIRIFRDMALKSRPTAAFKQIMGLVKEKVKSIETEDKIKGRVEGDWSGYDIYQDEENNKLYRKSLSNLNCVLWKTGFLGKIQKLQFVAKKIENSKITNIVMIFVVVLNAFILSLDYYGISDQMENALITMNLIFNVIFIAELSFRFGALGPKQFSRDSMNYVDTVVIFLSFIELTTQVGSSALNAFRVVRVFRILRIYRFARMLPFMKGLITVIGYSLPKFIYLALLLALLNLIYALLGNQIFAGKSAFGDHEIRANFDNFAWAYLSVFQVLTLSNYSEVLYNVMRSADGP